MFLQSVDIRNSEDLETVSGKDKLIKKALELLKFGILQILINNDNCTKFTFMFILLYSISFKFSIFRLNFAISSIYLAKFFFVLIMYS